VGIGDRDGDNQKRTRIIGIYASCRGEEGGGWGHGKKRNALNKENSKGLGKRIHLKVGGVAKGNRKGGGVPSGWREPAPVADAEKEEKKGGNQIRGEGKMGERGYPGG